MQSSDNPAEIVMSGGKLYLKKLSLADSALIVKWRNQDWVRKNYLYREDFTLEGQQAYYHSKIETGETVQFIVYETDTDRPVGCTVLNEFDDGDLSAEYGMFLGEADAAGRGYSPEMVKMTLAYAFGELGRKRVYCRIFTDNLPSIRGCERGGFKITATIKDCECTDGSRKDMYLLEAFAKEKK